MFEPRTRDAYLTLLRHGVRLGDAADQLGISRATPNRARKTDPDFAAAMGEALEVGAKVRREGVPHGEYRYNVLGCRCEVCTRAAAVARTARRTTGTEPEGGTGDTAVDDTNSNDPAATEAAGDVHPIRLERAVVGESSTSFLLARAS